MVDVNTRRYSEFWKIFRYELSVTRFHAIRAIYGALFSLYTGVKKRGRTIFDDSPDATRPSHNNPARRCVLVRKISTSISSLRGLAEYMNRYLLSRQRKIGASEEYENWKSVGLTGMKINLSLHVHLYVCTYFTEICVPETDRARSSKFSIHTWIMWEYFIERGKNKCIISMEGKKVNSSQENVQWPVRVHHPLCAYVWRNILYLCPMYGVL